MFNFKILSFKNFDWKLLLAVVSLVLMGTAAVYSVDLSRGEELNLFKKHLIACGIGFAILFFCALSKHTVWRSVARWWYWGSVILLFLVLFLGKNIRGTTGWFDLGFFSLQPVELAKIGLILILASIVSRHGRRFGSLSFFAGTGLAAFLPVALVAMQPDLGSAMLLAAIWFGLIWLVGVRKSFLIALIVSFVAFSLFAWFFLLKDYQKERVFNFIDPGRDPLDTGYNLTQSVIAIGSGKFFGRGLGFGSQSQLRFLPEAQTDFIFSVIGEELGLAGISIVLSLYALLFWRLLVLLKNTDDDFSAVVSGGVLILFFVQFITNIGATIGFLPITGVTLPFVSYGGSSLIANLCLVGIVESMAVREY